MAIQIFKIPVETITSPGKCKILRIYYTVLLTFSQEKFFTNGGKSGKIPGLCELYRVKPCTLRIDSVP